MEASQQVSSDLQAARQQIADLQRQLAQARLALEDFTYSVSHDLRAPLRHVGAYLKIIREDLGEALDPAIASQLQTAADAAVQMGRLMDGLLMLSRTGRAEMQLSDVDLAQLLPELQDKLVAAIGARAIVWRIAPDLPVVRGDLALLGAMLLALLDNAVKFTRQSAAAQIDIGWREPEPGWCELYIQDNGVGFDPRFTDRLFRAFQRLHSSKQFEGIGMGLALARLTVERHGGSIHARGESGAGCRIELTLALACGAAA
jgi:light-regulated signal transduction histidine kinase (bacteriophytochrome)